MFFFERERTNKVCLIFFKLLEKMVRISIINDTREALKNFFFLSLNVDIRSLIFPSCRGGGGLFSC